MFEFLKLDKTNGQATVWLNRPPLNVFNIAMMKEVIQVLTEIRTDSATRLLLIRGSGRCFSAGMDVGDHLPGRVHEMFDTMHQMMLRIAQLEIPTIALIHGSAMGGGLEFAVAADFVYSAEGCKIGQPEIKLGVFPPFAIAYFPQLIGMRNALDLILTGRTITAEEAVRMGLINEVFPPDEIESRTEQVCSNLLNLSRAGLAFTKKALYQDGAFDRLRAAEEIYLNELMKTEDAVEGLKAFLEKREPQWRHK
jgi:cyclohexa-1,5-dienecarbonyl-CoA hydratase